MEEIRKSAKTVDDAIAAALAELGAAREEVDITVIDEAPRAFWACSAARMPLFW